MIDKPNAAHFEALLNGVVLHGLDPVGLKARWAVANRLDCDMLHPTFESTKAILEAIEQVNAELKPHSMEVRLRTGLVCDLIIQMLDRIGTLVEGRVSDGQS